MRRGTFEEESELAGQIVAETLVILHRISILRRSKVKSTKTLDEHADALLPVEYEKRKVVNSSGRKQEGETTALPGLRIITPIVSTEEYNGSLLLPVKPFWNSQTIEERGKNERFPVATRGICTVSRVSGRQEEQEDPDRASSGYDQDYPSSVDYYVCDVCHGPKRMLFHFHRFGTRV
ncbi:hypothetical protein KM043_018134 [Ampulex compressa]|nr:hypothetical protein KM043_018134 [Ampulex compressa]